MKKGIMKLTVMTFVLAIIFSTSAMAQKPGNSFKKGKGERPSPEDRAARLLERMTKKLDLNDYQVDQIEALNTNMLAQTAAIKESDLEREEKKEAIKTLRDAHKDNIKALLDAEQSSKFEKWQENRGNKRKGRNPKGKDKKRG